jgi:hypothetical protein
MEKNPSTKPAPANVDIAGLPAWMQPLDIRSRQHVLFARHYAREFAHGAPGHLDLMTIATLAQLLDAREPHESGEQVSQ